MRAVEKYIEALKELNPEKIASCFTENAVFNDSAMVPMGLGVVHLEGRENILKGFRQMCSGDGFGTELLYHNENVVHYAIVGGPKCVGIGKEVDGLLKEYYVLPMCDTSEIK